MKKRYSRCIRGFTLVEVVVFLVILGVVGASILIAFSATLQETPKIAATNNLLNYMQERMELILASKRANGYSASYVDPCSTAPLTGTTVCLTTGYTITSTASAWATDSDFLSVTVTGQTNDAKVAVSSVQTLLGNY